MLFRKTIAAWYNAIQKASITELFVNLHEK